jgi:hypothetical protein
MDFDAMCFALQSLPRLWQILHQTSSRTANPLRYYRFHYAPVLVSPYGGSRDLASYSKTKVVPP